MFWMNKRTWCLYSSQRSIQYIAVALLYERNWKLPQVFHLFDGAARVREKHAQAVCLRLRSPGKGERGAHCTTRGSMLTAWSDLIMFQTEFPARKKDRGR